MDAQLKSIGLQNFQTIGSYQEFPFGKLTFLYGPNSSGKSSIRDAIETMQEVWGNKGNKVNPFVRDSESPSRLLIENRRRVNQRAVGDATRLISEVWVENKGSGYESDEINGINDLYKYLIKKNKITKIKGEVRYGQEKGYDYGQITELLLSVDEEPLVSWSHINDTLSVNLYHEIFSVIGYLQDSILEEIPDAIELTKSEGDYARLDQGWITCKADIYYEGDMQINFWRTKELIELHYGPENEDGSEELSDAIYNGIIDVGNIYNKCITVFSWKIFEGLENELIRGSRDVPADEELTYLVSPTTVEKDHEKWSKKLEKIYGFSLKGNPLYAHLATASAIRRIRNYATEAGLDESSIESLDFDMERQLSLIYLRPFDFINEALRDYLFLDKSYQLTSDLTFLQDIEDYFKQEPIKSLYGFGLILARLKLIDSTGNILSIDQVGSGIGYVLPILMGVYSSLYSSKFSILEQPELHLHPALQSSLCDVFVDACNKGTRLLIESHSEHILLRALRRVRETSSGRLKTPSLALNAEDMVVLYFEPHINGETKVKRLRVSDDGDFLDRWPNGFFSERDQDLFDE